MESLVNVRQRYSKSNHIIFESYAVSNWNLFSSCFQDQCMAITEMLDECSKIVAEDANTEPIINNYRQKLNELQ